MINNNKSVLKKLNTKNDSKPIRGMTGMSSNTKRVILISLTLGLLITIGVVGISSILGYNANAYGDDDLAGDGAQSAATSNGLFEIIDSIATGNGIFEIEIIYNTATSNGFTELEPIGNNASSNGLFEIEGIYNIATSNAITQMDNFERVQAVSIISVPNRLDFGSHFIGVTPLLLRIGDSGVRTSVDEAVLVVSNPYAATNWSIWATPQPPSDDLSASLADMLRIGSTGALGAANYVFNFSGETDYEEITITWQTLMENERDIQVFVPPGSVTPENYSAEIVWSIIPM